MFAASHGRSPAPAPSRKRVSIRDLSKSRRQLIELVRRLNFGWVEQLVVRDGEPVLSPLPKVVTERKLQGESFPPIPPAADDAETPDPFLRLFRYFDQIQDVTVERLLVKYALPFKLDAIEPPAE